MGIPVRSLLVVGEKEEILTKQFWKPRVKQSCTVFLITALHIMACELNS